MMIEKCPNSLQKPGLPIFKVPWDISHLSFISPDYIIVINEGQGKYNLEISLLG